MFLVEVTGVEELRQYAKLAWSAKRTLEKERPLPDDVQPRQKKDCRFLESNLSYGGPTVHRHLDGLGSESSADCFLPT